MRIKKAMMCRILSLLCLIFVIAINAGRKQQGFCISQNDPIVPLSDHNTTKFYQIRYLIWDRLNPTTFNIHVLLHQTVDSAQSDPSTLEQDTRLPGTQNFNANASKRAPDIESPINYKLNDYKD